MSHKLTLYISDPIIRRAKLFSHDKGISLSEMVESYLRHLTEPSGKNKKYFTDDLIGILSDSVNEFSTGYKKVKKLRLKKKYGI